MILNYFFLGLLPSHDQLNYLRFTKKMKNVIRISAECNLLVKQMKSYYEIILLFEEFILKGLKPFRK
jgi:hypothetical protein